MQAVTFPTPFVHAIQNSFVKYKKELLIGLALVLISQSRLRFAGMPIGLGELLLAVMMLYGVFLKPFYKVNQREGHCAIDFLSAIANYWQKKYTIYFGFIFLLAVVLPSLAGLSIYQAVHYHYLKHNLLAYVFVAFVFYYFLKSDIDFLVTALFFSTLMLFILCSEVLFL